MGNKSIKSNANKHSNTVYHNNNNNNSANININIYGNNASQKKKLKIGNTSQNHRACG